MPTTITSAYITTVRPDRTIVLPDEMAVGSTVAVVLLPSNSEPDEAARSERFKATLDAINNAAEADVVLTISEEKLDKLIKKAIRNSTA
jgi:hypothetical protein